MEQESNFRIIYKSTKKEQKKVTMKISRFSKMIFNNSHRRVKEMSSTESIGLEFLFFLLLRFARMTSEKKMIK